MLNQKDKDYLFSTFVFLLIAVVFYWVYLQNTFNLTEGWLRVWMFYNLAIVAIPVFNIPEHFFRKSANLVEKFLGSFLIFVCFLFCSVIIASGMSETTNVDIKVLESTSVPEGSVIRVSNSENLKLGEENFLDFKDYVVISNGDTKVYKKVFYKESKKLGDKVSNLEKVKYSRVTKTIAGGTVYKLVDERYILK